MLFLWLHLFFSVCCVLGRSRAQPLSAEQTFLCWFYKTKEKGTHSHACGTRVKCRAVVLGHVYQHTCRERAIKEKVELHWAEQNDRFTSAVSFLHIWTQLLDQYEHCFFLQIYSSHTHTHRDNRAWCISRLVQAPETVFCFEMKKKKSNSDLWPWYSGSKNRLRLMSSWKTISGSFVFIDVYLLAVVQPIQQSSVWTHRLQPLTASCQYRPRRPQPAEGCACTPAFP